jgi:hypothetical protein
MPADIRKTVEVSYKADVSELLKNLKSIPGMTEKEAKKMAAALSKQLRQTEKAAKKAAQTNSQAAKKMQTQYKKTAQSMNSMKRNAAQMGRGLSELSMIFGDNDSEMGKMVNKLGMIGITASALMPVFAAMRAAIISLGVSTAMATGGLSLLAGAAALMITNMGGGTSEAQKQNEKIGKLSKTYNKLSKRIQKTITKNAKFRKEMVATLTAITNLRTEFEDEAIELAFEMGDITKAQYETRKFENQVKASSDRITKSFETRATALKKSMRDESMATKHLMFQMKKLDEKITLGGKKKRRNFDYSEDLDNLEKMRNSYMQLGKAGDTLRETENKITKIIGKRPAAYKKLLADIILQQNLETEAAANFKSFSKERKENEESMKNLALENIETQREIVRLEEQKAANAAAKAKNDKNNISNEQRLAKIETQRNQLATIEFSLLKDKSSEIEKINLDINKQIQELKTLDEANVELANNESERINIQTAINNLEDQRKQKLDAIAQKQNEIMNQRFGEVDKIILEELNNGLETRKIKLQDLYAFEQELRDSKLEGEEFLHAEVMKMISKEEQARMNMTKKLLGNFQSFTSSRLQMMQNSRTEEGENFKNLSKTQQEEIKTRIKNEQEAIVKMFYLNQAASAAQVAFSTAEGIASSLKILPPAGPILALAAAAAGAAQMGAIMSQPPPQKKHMGGLVEQTGPDERTMTLLTGEGVISRRGMENIGENGLRRINEGKTNPEIIILQPFKHFGRYVNQRKKRMNTSGRGGY